MGRVATIGVYGFTIEAFLAALRSAQPELTGYETAVPGLFLTGAATFPGAGVWGASGRNCATVVLARTA